MMKNFKRADIIKSSIDDIRSVFNTDKLEEAFDVLESFGAVLTIITLGKEGSAAKIKGKTIIRMPSVKTEVVDTIGAGDNFSAGFLYYLHVNDISDVNSLLSLDEDFIVSMLAFASTIAAESLKVKGASIEKQTLDSLKNLQFT
jgi:fructokinase